MSRRPLRLSMLALLACSLQAFLPVQLHPQRPTSESVESDSTLEGKRIFAASCATCHGMDGRGGERGPNISNSREVQQLPDKAFLRIIQEGIAGTGMPAFASLGEAQIQALVRHLRSLQGQNPAEKLPGDPARGKTLFFGKAGCSQCHMANGEGGFIGSDLSRYASTQSMGEVRSAITDPNKNPNPRSRTVVVTTRNGKTKTGIVRNQDNFSLQIQTMDGAFQLFTKSELRSIEYQPQSLMPADYESRFGSQELDDLVSYLMSLGRTL